MALPTITSTKNPLAQQILKLARGPAQQRKDLFLLEGRHLFDEALEVGWPIDSLLLAPEVWPGASQKLEKVGCNARVFLAPRELQAKLGTNPSPEGYLGICKKRWGTLPGGLERGDFAVYLDCIQDPINVGMLVRSAKAFGCRTVVVGPGTADPFSPTALARSAGALLHLPPVKSDLAAVLEWVSKTDARIIGAAAGSGGDLIALPGSHPCLLALGNEGHGLSREILRACDMTVGVPMADSWDSLNVAVAGSILLYQMSKGAARADRPTP